jgi:hypothetical protein
MDGRGEYDGAIAIIGIACQFPGARDPAEFHDLTVAARRMFRPIPGRPGPMLHAALLDGWTDAPPLARISPNGPHDTGPIQKLTAETIALALADAGMPSTGLRDAGTRSGLVLASSVPGTGEAACEGFAVSPPRSLTATAAVSSLHAIAAACDGLRAGEFDTAIAGGAELGIDPDWLAQQATAGALGTDEMRVYDADPAGLLPGDGCGAVVLTRSADARAAGQPIYAEIVGWAVESELLSAYTQAQVDPADINLVEGGGGPTPPPSTRRS